MGGLTGNGTVVVNGVVSFPVITATYTVNADCTGTLNSVPAGLSQNFVVKDDGSQVFFIMTAHPAGVATISGEAVRISKRTRTNTHRPPRRMISGAALAFDAGGNRIRSGPQRGPAFSFRARRGARSRFFELGDSARLKSPLSWPSPKGLKRSRLAATSLHGSLRRELTSTVARFLRKRARLLAPPLFAKPGALRSSAR